MILHCPYCDARTNFQLWWHSGKNKDGGGPTYDSIVHPVTRYVFRCDNCEDFMFIRSAEGNIWDTFPFKETTKLLPGVPEPILEDLHEAHKCLAVSAFKACAAMCRRALQGAAIEKGANPKNKLIKQIEEIKGKGELHPKLAELATHIRLVGNSGAHPGEDGLDKVAQEEAEQILGFTEQVLDYLYVMPNKIESLKQKPMSETETQEEQ